MGHQLLEVAPMDMAIALITGRVLHFAPHHRIQIYIKHKDQLVEGSFGEDVFTYNGTLFPETPVVATGRTAIHQPQPDLTAYQGVPGTSVRLPEENWKDMTLWVDSNLILDQGDLQTYYRLQVSVGQREIPLPLHTPLMPVAWVGRGIFCIKGLGSLLA